MAQTYPLQPFAEAAMPVPVSVQTAKRYAFRIFGLYCLIFYVVPAVSILCFGNFLEAAIRPRPNYLLGILYVAVAFLLFALILKLPVLRLPLIGRTLAQLAFHPRLSVVYAAGFVLFALATRSTLGLEFRQTGEALAEVGAIGFLLQLLTIYFGVAIFVHYRMLHEGHARRARSATLLLIALGFAFSIQASLDVLFVFCALLASGTRWRRVFGLHLRITRRAALALMPLLVLAALFVGTANKLGVEQALATLSNLETIAQVFVRRLSYHFTSTSMHVSESFFNFGLFFEAIRNIFDTMLYRASVLFGLDGLTKPEVVSTARMNFLQLSSGWRARTGASPSILGSAFYFPGAGFAILYYVFIIRGVAMMLGRIMAPFLTNVPFLLLSMVTMAGVRDAALDGLNPLSPGFVRLCFLYLGLVYVLRTAPSEQTDGPRASTSTNLPKVP
ncbi:hypothetical protein [Gymnodinialimonas ceratoperidinii]|uniref:Uncharacterized protein n=1 Tax=Gymnodinialimonas ceratoperidinii TaxID=2856823 RepID=A0A8F6TX91_9RHOB|nr:hypothetical protein [Gymnodinialimonas ceratoperidinii]QXT39391.1 hypothetical protein KYE46_15910 [Gymnodinialimonas ceratoperidinii]